MIYSNIAETYNSGKQARGGTWLVILEENHFFALFRESFPAEIRIVTAASSGRLQSEEGEGGRNSTKIQLDFRIHTTRIAEIHLFAFNFLDNGESQCSTVQ